MKEIIVSGMRPTGALHLGHYMGVIKNWLELQKNGECYFFVADWHAMTSCWKDLDVIKKARMDYVRGWLAAGIDPSRAKIYNQSWIPEILKFSQMLLCLTPPGWADRSPSWKDQTLNPKKDLDNLGFYTYPVLQAADISIVHGNFVPVGEDQVSHIEISREIIRKFNRFYHTDLPEPMGKLTKVPKLPGIDGAKMSSSIGNVILLNETEKSLQKKINKLKTDELRNGIENPGNPDNCLVFTYHKIFSAGKMVQEVNDACRGAKLGCGECKQMLGNSMQSELMPIAQKFNTISDKECMDVLVEGTNKVAKKIKNNWEEIITKVKFN